MIITIFLLLLRICYSADFNCCDQIDNFFGFGIEQQDVFQSLRDHEYNVPFYQEVKISPQPVAIVQNPVNLGSWHFSVHLQLRLMRTTLNQLACHLQALSYQLDSVWNALANCPFHEYYQYNVIGMNEVDVIHINATLISEFFGHLGIRWANVNQYNVNDMKNLNCLYCTLFTSATNYFMDSDSNTRSKLIVQSENNLPSRQSGESSDIARGSPKSDSGTNIETNEQRPAKKRAICLETQNQAQPNKDDRFLNSDILASIYLANVGSPLEKNNWLQSIFNLMRSLAKSVVNEKNPVRTSPIHAHFLIDGTRLKALANAKDLIPTPEAISGSEDLFLLNFFVDSSSDYALGSLCAWIWSLVCMIPNNPLICSAFAYSHSKRILFLTWDQRYNIHVSSHDKVPSTDIGRAVRLLRLVFRSVSGELLTGGHKRYAKCVLRVLRYLQNMAKKVLESNLSKDCNERLKLDKIAKLEICEMSKISDVMNMMGHILDHHPDVSIQVNELTRLLWWVANMLPPEDLYCPELIHVDPMSGEISEKKSRC